MYNMGSWVKIFYLIDFFSSWQDHYTHTHICIHTHMLVVNETTDIRNNVLHIDVYA